jgi:hypothetical protein
LVWLLSVALAVSSLRFYYAEYTPLRPYGSSHGETATMLGHYLQDLNGDYQVYFFGPPRMYWGFGTMEFLAPDVPAYDVLEPITAPPEFVNPDRDPLFVFLPERLTELQEVRRNYPHGQIHELLDMRGTSRITIYEPSH